MAADVETVGPSSEATERAEDFGSPGRPHTGQAPTVVILASFTNVAPTTSASYWHDLYFGPTSSVRDFYEQASYGQLDFVAVPTAGPIDGVVGWVNLGYPHPDMEELDGSHTPWISLAIQAAAPHVDYASFDTNNDSEVQNYELHVVVVMAGAEGAYFPSPACGPSWHAHESSLGGYAPAIDGVTVGASAYTTVGERHCSASENHPATMGAPTHEMGHDLGWADLYDIDFSTNGVGDWSLMGTGAWTRTPGGLNGSSPALSDAFSKSLQGWVSPTQITSAVGLGVTTAATSPDVKRLLSNPRAVDWGFYIGSGAGEYFLIENRQQVGYDVGLPGCGLLIWHVDESATSSNSANSNDDHPLVALEQANGMNWLAEPGYRGSAGDPYPGAWNNTSFAPATNPNSNLYSGVASGATVSINSGSCASTMSVNVIAPSAALPPNDHFDNAAAIGPDASAGGTNIAATVEPGENTHASNRGGQSVWWKVTAPANGSMTITIASAAGATHVIVDVVGYYDPSAGDRFHPLAPTRVLDDREDIGLNGPWSAAQSRSLVVGGTPGIPTLATAVVMNVTATNGSSGSFLTVYPDQTLIPTSSSLNFGPGQTIPNLVVTALGANGAVAIYNELGTVDVVADINGYFAAT